MDAPVAQAWGEELERWLELFLRRLRRQAQRHWAPVYLNGLLLPGERKSVELMAARVAPGDTQQRIISSRLRPGSPHPWKTSWRRPPTASRAGRTAASEAPRRTIRPTP